MKTKTKLKKASLQSKPRTTCFKCGQEINFKKDNYLRLTSFNQGIIIEEVLFHLHCWGQYNQERVEQRLKDMAQQGMNMLRQGGIAA